MLKNVFGRREEEDRVREMNRLPAGQSLTQKFPVLHYGPTPQVDLATWDLKVFGLVEEDVTWNWEAFNKLPKIEITMDIHCVTRWSKFDTIWQGVSLKTLVDEGIIKPKPEAKYVIQHCEYGYTTNTPIEIVMANNFLLATHFNGEPLTREHGWPLRGVTGSFADRSEEKTVYLWKGGKWLRGLEFRADDQLGFWERAGYHNEADVWKEQRMARGRWF
ncbi:MAG: molybdopterin-dependent oxidoreductase [Anaerolineales bacterium]|nr:molybdopterin-dependent oxidoreductase [Anaerolineales bacterium]